MAATSNNTIIINAITTAVDTMVNQAIAFDAACDTVRAYRAADKLDDKTARGYFQAALLSKVPAYKGQLTDKGFPSQGSAFQRAVSRLMAATKPASADDAAATAEIEVPAAVLKAAAALWKLCAEYEGAAKLCATAIASVKAGK